MGFYLLDGFGIPARLTLALELGRVQKLNSSNTFAKLYVRLVRKDEQEKRILEISRKENLRIPPDMGRDTNAGRAGDAVETMVGATLKNFPARKKRRVLVPHTQETWNQITRTG